MKIRTGFVSNSSSSSFCCLKLSQIDSIKVLHAAGMSDNPDWNEIEEKKLEIIDHGQIKLQEDINIYLDYGASGRIGTEIGDDLARGTHSVNYLRKQLVKKIKKLFNVDVEESNIAFNYGELNDS